DFLGAARVVVDDEDRRARPDGAAAHARVEERAEPIAGRRQAALAADVEHERGGVRELAARELAREDVDRVLRQEVVDPRVADRHVGAELERAHARARALDLVPEDRDELDRVAVVALARAPRAALELERALAVLRRRGVVAARAAEAD